MEWLQISVSTTSECSELVAMTLYEAGSDGVSIKDDADIRELIEKKLSWDYVDESLLHSGDGKALVSGYFNTDFDVSKLYDALDALKENCVFPTGSLEVAVTRINSADWENEWRKYYSPIKLGKIVIVPAWLKAPEDGIPVYIEPGMAFGTGNHETTSMCVLLMQKIDLKGKTVLDMGCGSGILGITAVKLGAKKAVLSDIDPQAIQASSDNVRLNDVEEACTTVCGDLDTGKTEYDAVIANITADVLVRLKEQLEYSLKDGGNAVISGIINARAQEVKKAYSDAFETVETLQRGEWTAMLLTKKIKRA